GREIAPPLCGAITMPKKTKEMHPERQKVVHRRAFLRMIAGTAAVAAVAGAMPEVAAAKAPGGSATSKKRSSSHSRGGHLYMQTNETRNAIIHYRWAADGALTEVERVATGGAGSGPLSPIYHTSRPNDFEGAGSVILTPDRRFLFTT